MDLIQRITAFSNLASALKKSLDSPPDVFQKATAQNPWFIDENIQLAIGGLLHFLDRQKLMTWTSRYDLSSISSKTIGVSMAGNIPLVGFHDYLSILIAGHRAQIKLSSQDELLLPYVHDLLVNIEPRFQNLVAFVDKLKGYDAAIATGSDNTGRYFSYYFKDVPHIIRKNKSSAAVLIGGETEEEIHSLGLDVFTYFGLGCRNVSKLFIPEEYDLIPILRSWEKFSSAIDHNKFANNYNYQRSIHLINQKHFFDNGAILLMEDTKLVSPIGVVYYEKYADQNDLTNKLNRDAEKIQCIVSAKGWYKGSIPFGKAQQPEVWDYADNVDTMSFLTSLAN